MLEERAWRNGRGRVKHNLPPYHDPTLPPYHPTTHPTTHPTLFFRLFSQPTGIGVVTCFARLAGIVAANTLTGLWHVSHAATLGVCSAGCLLAAVLVHRSLPRDTAGARLRDAVGEPELFGTQGDAPSWEGPPIDAAVTMCAGAAEVADSALQGAATTRTQAPKAMGEGR